MAKEIKLHADEKKLEFEGFSAPTAAYRVDRTRVKGAGCLIVGLVVMALIFVAFGIMFSDDDRQKNLWLLLLIFGGFAALWLGMAVWMLRRLGPGKRQRVLLYPEGIVFWRDDEAVAYAWDEIDKVSQKEEQLAPQNRGLVMLAMVGKDFVVTIKFKDGTEVTLTALLLGLDELAERVKKKIAKAPPPAKPGKPGAGEPPTAVSDNPFDF